MAITLANYNATLEFDASKFQKGMSDSSKQFDDFAKNAQSKAESLGKTIKNALNVASGAALGAGVFSVKQASEFETSLHKLSTIADTSKVSMDDFGDSLKNLSNETGQSASSLANVAYNAISAGTDTKDAMDMVETATKLAVGGFTDAESALSVLTTAQNAYGDSAGSAMDIADSLITVQNEGVVVVGELSSVMGKAIAMGSGYGVNLSNIESAYISMTKQGISAAEGTTYLNSMIKELGKDGSDVSNILKEKTGKSFGQLMQDGASLSDVIKILMDSCDGNTEAFKQLWSSAEGGMAASAIVNEGLDTFNENLNKLENSSGATEKAYATMSDTFEFKAGQLKQNITNLGITIGNELLPHITNVVEKVTDWINKFSEMDDSTKQMIIQVGGFIAVLAPLLTVITKVGGTAVKFVQLGQSISGMITAAGGIPAIMAQVGATIGSVALPIVGVIAVIGALVGAFVHLWNTNEDFRNKITEIWTNIKTTVENFVNEVKTKLESVGITFESVTTTLKNIWQGFCDFMAPVFEGAFQNLSIILETVFGVLSGVLSVFIGIFTGDWSQAWDGVKQIFDSVWNGIKSFFQNVINTVKNIAKVFLSWFGGDWKSTFTNVKNTTSTIFNGIKTVISTAINVVKNVVKTGFNAVKTTVSTVTNAVKTTVSNGWTTIKNKISTVGNAIKTNVANTFNNVKTKISTITSSIKQSASTGWTNLKTSITNAASGIKQNAVNHFNNLKQSISTNVSNTRTNAQNAWSGMKQSLTNTASSLKTSVVSSFTGLQQSVTNSSSTLKSSVTSSFTGLQQSVNSAVNSTKATAVATFNGMASSLKSTASSAKSAIVSSFNSIKSGVSSAMSSAKHKAVSAWSGIKSKFNSVGRNIISGIKAGVSSAAGSLYSKLRDIAHKALAAAKNALGVHSPSKKFKEEVGVNIVKGIIAGIDAEKKNANKSAIELANLYVKAAKDKVKAMKKNNELAVRDEIKLWKELLKYTKEGTSAYLSVQLALINAQAKRQQQSTKAAANDKKQLEQDANIYLKTAQEQLKTLKKNGKITEAQEITFWERITNAISKGTKAYKESQKQYVNAKKQLKNDVTNLTKEFAQDIAKVQKTLEQNISDLKKKYSQSVADRKNEIMGKNSVTDYVKINDNYLTKSRLRYNLKNQVAAYKEWSDTLTKLEKRIGADSPLMKELRGMGVEQTNTLKAINSMNAKELKSYISLYNQKAKIAKDRSLKENATLLKDTNKQIKNLQTNAKKQINELTKTYRNALNDLGARSQDKSTVIGKQIVAGISQGLKKGESGLSSTLKKMINKLIADTKKRLKIKSPSGVFRDEVGKFIPLGISEGIDKDKSVVKSMEQLGDNAIDAINTKSGVKLDALISDAGIALKSDWSNSFSKFVQSTKGMLSNAVSSGASALSNMTMNHNVVINMGDIAVSGVLDKDAAQQVKEIADNQVNELKDYLDANTYQDVMGTAKKDPNFERMVQDMTLGRVTGKSKFDKLKRF